MTWQEKNSEKKQGYKIPIRSRVWDIWVPSLEVAREGSEPGQSCKEGSL